MHTKMTVRHKVAAFERLLEALAQELVESSDEELLAAASDLGMDLRMRGSAAFVGLKYPAVPGFSDFFEARTAPSDTALPLEARKRDPK